jgi:glycosyltransferase involved in cell wall biosynthesis
MCLKDGNGSRLRGRLEIGSRPSVLFLGRRDEGKGYTTLLQAWKRVIEVVSTAVLLLAGPGSLEYSSLGGDIPNDSVRDLGTPDEQEKADALAACDVFCLPSAHESFGIVYVEAWSYGKPVICGTAPACRELVQDNKTGLWADQNPQSLAGKIISLLKNPSAAQRMGACGRAFQQANFTQASMLQTHLAAWKLSTWPSTQRTEAIPTRK